MTTKRASMHLLDIHLSEKDPKTGKITIIFMVQPGCLHDITISDPRRSLLHIHHLEEGPAVHGPDMDEFLLGLAGHQDHLNFHRAHQNAQHCADPGNGDGVAEQGFQDLEGGHHIQSRLERSLVEEDIVEKEVGRRHNCLDVGFLRMAADEEKKVHKAVVESCMVVVVVGLTVLHRTTVGLPVQHRSLAVAGMVVLGERTAEVVDCTELRLAVGTMLAEQNQYNRHVGCYAMSTQNCYLAENCQCLRFEVSIVSHTEDP